MGRSGIKKNQGSHFVRKGHKALVLPRGEKRGDSVFSVVGGGREKKGFIHPQTRIRKRLSEGGNKAYNEGHRGRKDLENKGTADQEVSREEILLPRKHKVSSLQWSGRAEPSYLGEEKGGGGVTEHGRENVQDELKEER